MKCIRCGQCCISAILHITLCGMTDEFIKDYARWLSFHGCDDMKRIDNDKGSTLMFRIPKMCTHLSFDTKNGLSSCAIYKDRPMICKDYLCERIGD